MSARGSMLSIWANQRQPWFRPWGAHWNKHSVQPAVKSQLDTIKRSRLVKVLLNDCISTKRLVPPAWSRRANAAGWLRRTGGSSRTSSSGNCPDLQPQSRPRGNQGSWKKSGEQISLKHVCLIWFWWPKLPHFCLLWPLVFLHGCAFFHGRVVWDGVRTFLVQVCQDELSHSGMQLPDTGGHHADGERRFVVSSHFLFSLFLQTEKSWVVRFFSGNDTHN